MTTSNPASVANEYVTKQSQKLAEMAQFNLQLAKMVDKDTIQERNGKTVRYYTEPNGAASQVVALTEGAKATDLTPTEIETGYVDVTLSPLVWHTDISDLYMSTGFINKFKMAQRVGAQSIALKADAVIRDVILAKHLNSDTSAKEIFSGYDTGDSSTDYASLAAGTAAAGKITEADFLRGLSQIDVSGYGVEGVVMNSEVFNDFRQDAGVRAALNQMPESVVDGKFYNYWGTKILVTNRGSRETTYGTYVATGAQHATFFIAKGAIVAPTWKVKNAGTDFMAPKWIIPTGPDKYDVADTHNPVTAKAYYNAAVVKEKGVLILRSRATKNFIAA